MFFFKKLLIFAYRLQNYFSPWLLIVRHWHLDPIRIKVQPPKQAAKVWLGVSWSYLARFLSKLWYNKKSSRRFSTPQFLFCLLNLVVAPAGATWHLRVPSAPRCCAQELGDFRGGRWPRIALAVATNIGLLDSMSEIRFCLLNLVVAPAGATWHPRAPSPILEYKRRMLAATHLFWHGQSPN